MRTDVAIPAMMRALAIDAFGGPEKLTVHEVRVPAVDPHEVLIRVDTAGVGIWDAKFRRGEFSKGQDRFPMVLGAEGSGTIAALGDDVRGLQLGDAAYGYAYGDRKGGFYAEYVALRASHVAPMPESLDFREAGGLAVTGVTALTGIADVLAVKPGQTILVHGASGGVGTIAVQLAKRFGARVFATATGGDGRELLRKLGVDEPIDTHHDDVLAVVRRVAPDGVDGLLALAGGAGLERCIAAVRQGGTIAHPNGVAMPAGVASTAFNGVPNPAVFARLNAIIDANPIDVPIGSMYSLDDGAEAHRRLERGHVLGKIVIVIDATEDVVEKVA
jgi:NADPH2:quinone reductase